MLVHRSMLLFVVRVATFVTVCFTARSLEVVFVCNTLTIVIVTIVLLCGLVCPGISELIIGGVYVLVATKVVVVAELSARDGSPCKVTVHRLMFIIINVIFNLVIPILVQGVAFLRG